MDKDFIISKISQLARRMFRNNEGKVYLFGSQARNEATSQSDWDILIITDDELHTDDDFLHFAFPYAELGWQYGQQITPLHYSRSQWESEKGTPFYANVLTDAIQL